MKKIVIITVLFIVVGAAVNAQAASVTFNPDEVVLQVAPGQRGRALVSVDGYSDKPHNLNFLLGQTRKNNSIPSGWLASAYLWLESQACGTSSNTTVLIVEVPPDAKPGTYSAQLEVDDMRSSEPIVSKGVNFTIEVSSPDTKKWLSDSR